MVYHKMGDFDSAIAQHTIDLDLSTEDGSGLEGAARALSNLGAAHEALGQADEAVRFYERHLGAANQLDDPAARTQAYENLGRLQHGRGNLAGAVEYLERGLSIAEQGPNSIEKFWLEF